MGGVSCGRWRREQRVYVAKMHCTHAWKFQRINIIPFIKQNSCKILTVLKLSVGMIKITD